MHVTRAGGQRARVTVAFAAALAVVVPGASVSPRVVTAAEACVDGWSKVTLPPELAAMEPQGAASLNGQPAWIVGIASARQESRAPLIARWRNGQWQKTTGPWKGYGVLNAVVATSSSNAWAVGSLGSYTRWPISARWDGSAWKAVSVPRPKGQLATLVDIAMISPPQRFWAVGARLNLGQVKPVAMKRRPGGWRFLNPSAPSGTEAALTDVTVAPGGRTWAAGWRSDGTRQGRPWVIYRRDGKWRNSPLGAVAAGRASIMDLTFSGSSSGWAVGFVERSGGVYAPILQRWNGSVWTAQDLPWAAGRSILLHAVEATAEGDLIVAGMDVDNIRQDVLARLDASGWKVTSLSSGTRFNSVMMDTAPTSSGGFAAGFFDRQPMTMFACAGGAVKPSLTSSLTAKSDASPALVDEPTHDEDLDEDMRVAADTTSVQPMSIANTIAVDMTAAAGLQLSAPTWEGLVADFTGDGRDDLFIGLHYQQLPKLMVNSQSGIFSEQPANFVWQDRHGCDAADVERDGALDLYCTIGVNKGTSNTPQEFLLNVADHGGALAARQFGVLDGFGRGRNVTFLDLGGDPYPDLYVMNEPSRSDAMSSSNRLYRNVDGTAFWMAPEWGVDRSMGGSCGLGADLDGDGDDELIVCSTKQLNGQPAGARLFVNEGDRFVDRTAVAGLVPAGDSDVAVDDFDGDGLPDIAQLSSTRLLVSLAAGDGTFVKSFELQTTGAVAMAVGDVDDDGRPDIYVARRTGGNSGHLMLVNRNAATDFVSMTIPQPGSGRADDVMAIDYDLNGRTDFITLNGWDVSGPVKLTAFFAEP